MIIVKIPFNQDFNYQQCKKLYEENQHLVEDDTKFDDVIKYTFFYSFFENDSFIGCIYYYYKGDKLFLNGFANRHFHKQNLECLKMSLDWFNCDIYAKGLHKTSRLCLLKSGFKKISDNLYKYERR